MKDSEKDRLLEIQQKEQSRVILLRKGKIRIAEKATRPVEDSELRELQQRETEYARHPVT